MHSPPALSRRNTRLEKESIIQLHADRKCRVIVERRVHASVHHRHHHQQYRRHHRDQTRNNNRNVESKEANSDRNSSNDSGGSRKDANANGASNHNDDSAQQQTEKYYLTHVHLRKDRHHKNHGKKGKANARSHGNGRNSFPFEGLTLEKNEWDNLVSSVTLIDSAVQHSHNERKRRRHEKSLYKKIFAPLEDLYD